MCVAIDGNVLPGVRPVGHDEVAVPAVGIIGDDPARASHPPGGIVVPAPLLGLAHVHVGQHDGVHIARGDVVRADVPDQPLHVEVFVAVRGRAHLEHVQVEVRAHELVALAGRGHILDVVGPVEHVVDLHLLHARHGVAPVRRPGLESLVAVARRQLGQRITHAVSRAVRRSTGADALAVIIPTARAHEQDHRHTNRPSIL